MHHLVKDTEFRDNPPNPDFRSGMSPYRELLTTYTVDLPEVQEIVAMMRAVIEEYDDRMLVGEIYLPVERLMGLLRREWARSALAVQFSIDSIALEGQRDRCCCRAIRSPASFLCLAQLGARKS